MPIPPPATTCPLAPRRRPSAICHPPAAAVPATSWPICAFPGPIPGGKACPDRTTKCSHKDSHQLAHLRIRQCNSWCRDPPDRTTNDSHEGHQLVLQTELIDLHATKQPQGQLDTQKEARCTYLPISSPESIRLGGNEDFLAHPPPFGAMTSFPANPVASASPHGRCWDARDAENVATNRAACNQRDRPRDQLVPWTPQGGSLVLQRPSISRVQAPASETSARQSSESGFLLRPSFGSGGMAVERAARRATSASVGSIPAAVDEKADLAVARVGFLELQS